MTIIYFIRHAHSIYTEDERNRPLSNLGEEQVEGLLKVLSGVSFDYVFSSPYLRAIQTVEGLGKPVIPVEDLRERILSQTAVESFHDAMELVWRDDDFSFAGGESNRIARERGKKTMDSLLTNYPDETIAIGTHGNILTLILGAYGEGYDYPFWQSLRMPDCLKVCFEGQALVTVTRIPIE